MNTGQHNHNAISCIVGLIDHPDYDYLLKKPSWSITAVEDINSSTDEIMNALTNPRKGVAGEQKSYLSRQILLRSFRLLPQ